MKRLCYYCGEIPTYVLEVNQFFTHGPQEFVPDYSCKKHLIESIDVVIRAYGLNPTISPRPYGPPDSLTTCPKCNSSDITPNYSTGSPNTYCKTCSRVWNQQN